MDQNFSSFQNYQPGNDQEVPFVQIKDAAYFRAKARAALKPCFGIAILVFLLASLLGGVTEGGVSFSFSSSSSGTEANVEVPVSDSALEQIVQNGDWGALIDELPPMVTALLIVAAFSAVIGIALSIFVSSPIRLGYQRFNLDLIDAKNPSASVLFDYFKKSYFKSIGLSLLYTLFTFLICLPAMVVAFFVFLPALLQMFIALPEGEISLQEYQDALTSILLPTMITFVVGVVTIIVQTVFRYSYGYCYMILAEYPEMSVMDAFRGSRTLMKGRKWKRFCLDFSFIGWVLLTVLAGMLTCGIGAVVGEIILNPYMHAASAAFYDDAANRQAAREAEFPSLDPEDYSFDAGEQENIAKEETDES